MPGNLVCPVRHAVDLFVAVVDRCSNFSTCVGTTEYVGGVKTRCAGFAAASEILCTSLHAAGDRWWLLRQGCKRQKRLFERQSPAPQAGPACQEQTDIARETDPDWRRHHQAETRACQPAASHASAS